MQQKQEQLLDIIKEELKRKDKEVHVQKVIPLLTPDLVQYMIVNDLPIYEDHLKDLLFDQSRDKIGTVIQQLEYDKNLKAQQDEMERQIFLKKTQKRKKKLEALRTNNPELFLQKTQPQQPETQLQQLQNNFAKLMQNFTQIIAAKVVQEIKQPNRKGKKKKAKRPSTPEFDQSLKEDQDDLIGDSSLKENQKNQQTIEKKHLPINKIIQNNQQIQLQQRGSQHQQHQEKQKEDESFKLDSQIQPNQKQPSYLQQSLAYSQSQQDSAVQKFDQQRKNPNVPGSSSLQYNFQEDYSSGDLESYDDVEPLQQNKSKPPPNQSQINQFQQSSDDYPDDFIEESNDKFQQNLSNFYKPKTQVPPPEQIDFDDDIEDLLL